MILKKSRKTALHLLTLASLFTFGATALADSSWVEYLSETGLYNVKIPKEHKSEYKTFRIDDDKVLYSGELTAEVDQRPYKNAIKSYIVKIDQTFSTGLSNSVMQQLLGNDLQAVRNQYISLGGIIKDTQYFKTKDLEGGEIYITYPDKNFGEQSIKYRVTFNTNSRIQQLVVGPDHIMNDHETLSFMKSLKSVPGVSKAPGELAKDWKQYSSPFDLFTLALPPVQPPYVPANPQIQSSGRSELVSMSFYDPVLSQYLYYNTYGYRFNNILTFSDASKVLLQGHIIKQRKTQKGISINRTYIDSTPVVEAEYSIPAPDNYPYVSMVKLRAFFQGNYMMVQEIMGSPLLVNSPFIATAMNLCEFHPERAAEHYKKERMAKQNSPEDSGLPESPEEKSLPQ